MPSKKEKLPLSVTHPELAKEADGWDPSLITFGVNKNLPWICSADETHSWEASPNKRTSGRGCPYCSGNRVISGKTDLLTVYPELALEANGWDPSRFSTKSDKRVSWICSKNSLHIWEASIKHRTSGTGCPYCANRKIVPGMNDLATEFPELALQASGFDPTRYSRGSSKRVQWICPKDNSHIWFATIAARTAGGGCPYCSHRKVFSGQNDLATKHPEIAAEAYNWDPTQFRSFSGVLQTWKCKVSADHIWKDTPGNRVNGRGCPYCSGHQVLVGFNDLETTHPEIAELANGWDPSLYSRGSNKRLNWKCKKNPKHLWRAQLNSLAGCPFCSNRKILVGENDLKTTHPQIASEAFEWDPTTVTAGSMAKKKWKCSNNPEHIWSASTNNRARISGCPNCANSGYDQTTPGYLYFLSHPEWLMYQIGISNSPEQRIFKHQKKGWELIEVRGPIDGNLAVEWETAILRMLKAKGADLSNEKIAGKFDGYSEAWSKSTFESKSIKELMRLTEEFESDGKTR
ncbi:zinc-ribbon domain-containing protein [Candidatus Planktophila versatilis]|nr:zinc-ribbon domain-containing protein [Candidatus Planktophila versatilis]